MKVQTSASQTQVSLSKPLDTRPKILNFIYFLAFSGCAFGFTKMVGKEAYMHLGAFVFLLISGGIYLFAGYRFINKAMETERLLIIPDAIIISRRGLFNSKTTTYLINKIQGFTYVDKPQLAPHPLAGQTFDYLGFQTEQAVINEMHGDDRIAFAYDGKSVSFGENQYSWDFDELMQLIFQRTGSDFRQPDNFDSEEKNGNLQ